MDVLKVKEAGARATAHCRAGKGPYILELKTYRYRGHSMSDPAKYRTRDEVQRVRERRDPIDQLRKRLVGGDHVAEAALKDIDREVKEIVTEAAEFARNSREPEPSELYSDVLVDA